MVWSAKSWINVLSCGSYKRWPSTPVTMTTVSSWDEFLRDNLLQSNLFCGVCLISQLGEVVHTYRQLQNFTEKDTQQFLLAFRTTSQTAEQEVVQRGFVLRQGAKSTSFKIYTKTYCSIYCTSSDKKQGLIISRIPYGILICLYIYPVTAAKAVKEAELFCDKLRAWLLMIPIYCLDALFLWFFCLSLQIPNALP